MVSEYVSVYSMDATYLGIYNDEECSWLCRNMTAFHCFSFDYCATRSMCQLSAHHTTDGRELKKNFTCDHYSSMVTCVFCRPEFVLNTFLSTWYMYLAHKTTKPLLPWMHKKRFPLFNLIEYQTETQCLWAQRSIIALSVPETKILLVSIYKKI